MASYRVEWKPSTKRDLRKIAQDQVVRIVEAVAALGTEPRPVGSQKLQGTDRPIGSALETIERCIRFRACFRQSP